MITITRYAMPALRLAGGGMTRDYDFSDDPPDAFCLWRQDVLIGVATEYEAAIQMAERFARQLGIGVRDLVVETTEPDRRPQWP